MQLVDLFAISDTTLTGLPPLDSGPNQRSFEILFREARRSPAVVELGEFPA